MKKIVLSLFISFFLFVSLAQKDSTTIKDASNSGLSYKNIYALNQPKENISFLVPHFSFEIRRMSPHFDLFYDSLYIRHVLFNEFPNSDYNKYYDYNMRNYMSNPMVPYGNFESALICGSLNYIIFLLEKK